MVLQIDDWKFDIDMVRTMEYSASEAAEHCDCAYCRNFYATVDGGYPELRPFFAQFGIDIEAPDELMPYDLEGQIYYDGVYMVCGRVLQAGRKPMILSDIAVSAAADDAVRVNHHCPEPCFALYVSTVVLPWALKEPMEDAVSPANEPSFLEKMWSRLLGRARKNCIDS